MKFTDLEISDFGIWSGLELRDLSPQLTVLWGPNEAGKTTILEAIRGVLYGYSAERRGRYLPPVHGGDGGAVLEIDDQGGHFSIARDDDGLRPAGSVTVTTPDGTTQGDPLLSDLLSGVDEAIFTNVFAVGLRELQELATLDGTEAARLLYDLSTGLDRVSLAEVIRELRNSRNRLLASDGGKSQILDLLAQRAAIEKELADIGTLTARYWRLLEERNSTDEAIRQAEQASAAIDSGARRLEVALNLRGVWGERARLDAQIAAHGTLGDFPPHALRRLESAIAGLRKAKRRRAKLRKRRRVLRQELRGIAVNEPFWRQSARIEALAEHEPWIASLESQLAESDARVAELERQAAAEWSRYGLAGDGRNAAPAANAHVLATLKGPARHLREARKRLKQVRDQLKDRRKIQGRERGEVEGALAARGVQDLNAALEKQGNLVTMYRRRLQLDDRLDQMALHRNELRDTVDQLIDKQVIPMWMLVTLAAVFVVGAGLVIGGLLLPASVTGSWGYPLAFLGLLVALGAVGSKFGIERSAANRLESSKKQSHMLDRQIENAKNERDELDRQLPSGGGSLTSRLQAAEAELASLEELLGLDARRQTADEELKAAKQTLREAGEQWQKSRRRWQQSLAAVGLPESLLPQQVKQLAEQGGGLTALEQQLEQARDERERRRRELSAVATRIEQLWSDAGWERTSINDGPGKLSLVEQLRRLRRELVVQEQQAQRRNEIEAQLERLRRLYLKYGRRARSLARRRRELLQAAGAIDEHDFRRRAEQQAEIDKLLGQHAALNREVQHAIAGVCPEQQFAALVNQPLETLEKQRSELTNQRTAAGEQIKQLLERRGQLNLELAQLADDRRPEQKQLELGIINERLAEAAARWRTVALTEHLLESVKEAYERDRQPVTLQQASGYLERMTGDRYRRVWTTLGESRLLVDEQDGASLPVEVLSTGAREQLFLSLRLALASQFAAQGKAMPLVLDDVLVNFDAERAEAAAAVFVEYAAEGRQVVLFTCHEHISRLFRSLGADVRRLPSNAHANQKIVGPEEHQTQPPRERAETPRRRRRAKEPVLARIESTPIVVEAEPVTNLRLVVPEDDLVATTEETASEPIGEAMEILAIPPGPIVEVNGAAHQDFHGSDKGAEAAIRPPARPSRKRRADAAHSVAPMKTPRPRWSGEEFEGELEDRVNTSTAFAWRQDAAHSTAGERHDRDSEDEA